MAADTESPRNGPKVHPRRGALREVVTWYTPVEAALGAGVGIWAATTDRVLAQEPTILLAFAGAAVGLLAVTLTAMTLVITFLEDFFGEMIKDYGVRRFFRPYVVVTFVSAIAAVVSFAGAIDNKTGPTWTRDVLFGLATWLIVWAIGGAARLVPKLVGYADVRAKIEGIPKQHPRKSPEPPTTTRADHPRN
jgi:hypothetical protein